MATIKFETALHKFEATMLKIIDLEVKTGKTVEGMWSNAFTDLLETGAKAGTPSAEMSEKAEELAEAHMANFRAPKTVKMYLAAFRWAAGRGIQKWTTGLITTEGKIQSLTDAGKKVPKDLELKYKKVLENQAVARDAKQSKTSIVNKEGILKGLAKQLADARTLGDNEWATYILDAIIVRNPEFKEPTVDAK